MIDEVCEAFCQRSVLHTCHPARPWSGTSNCTVRSKIPPDSALSSRRSADRSGSSTVQEVLFFFLSYSGVAARSITCSSLGPEK